MVVIPALMCDNVSPATSADERAKSAMLLEPSQTFLNLHVSRPSTQQQPVNHPFVGSHLPPDHLLLCECEAASRKISFAAIVCGELRLQHTCHLSHMWNHSLRLCAPSIHGDRAGGEVSQTLFISSTTSNFLCRWGPTEECRGLLISGAAGRMPLHSTHRECVMGTRYQACDRIVLQIWHSCD